MRTAFLTTFWCAPIHHLTSERFEPLSHRVISPAICTFRRSRTATVGKIVHSFDTADTSIGSLYCGFSYVNHSFNAHSQSLTQLMSYRDSNPNLLCQKQICCHFYTIELLICTTSWNRTTASSATLLLLASNVTSPIL